VRHLLGSREGMLTFMHHALSSVTEEEYDLCVRQFVDSVPNLIKVLVSVGKLPAWALED
jgi:hypothetical protein